MYILQSNYKIALQYLNNSLNQSIKKQSKYYKAFAINLIATIDTYEGNYDSALVNCTRALKIFKSIDSKIGLANSYSILGHIYRWKGDYKKSKDYHQQALKIFKALRNPVKIAHSWTGIALAEIGLKNHAEALIYIKKSLSLNKKMNCLRGIAYILRIF